MEPTIGTGLGIPTSVTLPPGATAEVRLPDTEPIELNAEVLAQLFSAGLRVPAAERTGPRSRGRLIVDDEVSWLIGATPVDADFALAAVARGIERALREAVENLTRTTATDRPAGPTRPPRKTGAAGASRSVPVELAEHDLEVLIDEAAAGARITLTREEQAVAVILPWPEYRQMKAIIARLDLAEWAAWTDRGGFDHATFSRVARGEQGAAAEPAPKGEAPA